MYRQIGPVARSDMSVLLRGASGTGKEHIAAEIHEQSLRRNKPFIAVDCGAVTDGLGGSEFSATVRVRSPERTVTGWDFSMRRKAARCFWMKSGTLLP